MEANKKFRWINDDIIIDFPVPKLLKNMMQEAEELDLRGSVIYTGMADQIDVTCKEYVTTGRMTQEQWDKIADRYPVV